MHGNPYLVYHCEHYLLVPRFSSIPDCPFCKLSSIPITKFELTELLDIPYFYKFPQSFNNWISFKEAKEEACI